MTRNGHLLHTWMRVPGNSHRRRAVHICADCALMREHPWFTRIVYYLRGDAYVGRRAPECPNGRLRRRA